MNRALPPPLGQQPPPPGQTPLLLGRQLEHVDKYWKKAKNTGKVREKSRNFVSPEKWEP